MRKCAKCQERPRAHPKSAYCVECRREYNQELRARKAQTSHTTVESRTGSTEELAQHLSQGGQCSDYNHYWDMTARDVSQALGWYESNSSQERDRESS